MFGGYSYAKSVNKATRRCRLVFPPLIALQWNDSHADLYFDFRHIEAARGIALHRVIIGNRQPVMKVLHEPVTAIPTGLLLSQPGDMPWFLWAFESLERDLPQLAELRRTHRKRLAYALEEEYGVNGEGTEGARSVLGHVPADAESLDVEVLEEPIREELDYVVTTSAALEGKVEFDVAEVQKIR